MNVAISGINDTDNPGPGVGIARSLKDADETIRTIGISYDAQDPGNYMDFIFDKTYLLPYPTKGWEAAQQRLIHIKSNGGLDVLLPSLDAELPMYIMYQDELAAMGIKTLLPTKKQFELRSKEHLDALAKILEINHPKTIKTSTIEQLQKACREIGFPCVVKGNYYKAYRVGNLSDAIVRFSEISAEWGFPVLVQEMAYGDELNVIGVGDGEGGTLGLVAAKKLTTTSLGKFWNGITITHPKLLEVTENFVKQTKWRGPFELECMVKSDTITLIEINPRFPSWVYFATAVGINLPQRLLDFIEGKEVARERKYPAGKIMIRYTYEMITDIDALGTLSTQGENRENL